MGLFFNRKNHTDIYKGNSMDDKNQAIFRTDSVSEALLEQKKAIELMNATYSEMDKQLQTHRTIQSDRWNTAGMRFEEILDYQSQHRQFEQEAIQTLENLDRKHIELQKLLDNKQKVNEELVEQINLLSQSNSEIAERLDKFDADQEKLLAKMDEQIEKQDHFSYSLEEQKIAQTELVDRIEQHEGLIEKMMRQLDFLRTVIFERSHFIAEKIDKSYQLTTTYISNVRGKSNSESK